MARRLALATVMPDGARLAGRGAARPSRDTAALGDLIERRLRARVRRWPRPLSRALRTYLASRPGWERRRRRPADLEGRRSWLLLPQWLLAGSRASRRPGAARLLRDIQWGQYCAFLFVRIHDDLFDAQGRRPAGLLFAADLLLLEAETAFHRHFPSGPFWRHFRRALRTSLEAIAAVDACQRRPRRAGAELPALYARVAAVFQVGALAACVATHQLAAWRRVARVADSLAVASQLLDDLGDIEEDLARGRINYAAARLHGTPASPRGSLRLTLRRIAQGAWCGDALERFLDEVRRSLGRARRAAAALHLPAGVAYVQGLEEDLARLDQALHQLRVRAVLGP